MYKDCKKYENNLINYLNGIENNYKDLKNS